MATTITLPPAADMHVHLRAGAMMETVVPTIRRGGVNLVYVMPNLIPPITSVAQAIAYHSELQRLDPDTTFLMSLYLSPEITPATIAEAASSGIVYGVKSYPKGLTTNSEQGVVSYEQFYPVFAEMERFDLVFNIHGEAPSGPDTTILNAEEMFLPTLKVLHEKFPRLRIVLEHCTTAAAVKMVESLGDTVGATITAHHLYLTIDQWSDSPHCYCKPVAKLPGDRSALIAAAVSGNPKFFLGTDSAPHPKHAKQGAEKVAAGVFTQPYAVQLVAEVFDREGKLDRLQGFVCEYGRRFYKTEELGVEKGRGDRRWKLRLTKNEKELVEREIRSATGEVVIVPFRAGERTWSLEWVKDD